MQLESNIYPERHPNLSCAGGENARSHPVPLRAGKYAAHREGCWATGTDLDVHKHLPDSLQVTLHNGEVVECSEEEAKGMPQNIWEIQSPADRTFLVFMAADAMNTMGEVELKDPDAKGNVISVDEVPQYPQQSILHT